MNARDKMLGIWGMLQRSRRNPSQESYSAQDDDEGMGEPLTDKDEADIRQLMMDALDSRKPTPGPMPEPEQTPMSMPGVSGGPKSHIEMKRVPYQGKSAWSIKQVLDN